MGRKKALKLSKTAAPAPQNGDRGKALRTKPKSPASGWTVIGDVVRLRFGSEDEAKKTLVLLFRSPASYLTELQTRNGPCWLEPHEQSWVPLIRARLEAAAKKSGNDPGRVFCDSGSWAEWDAFLAFHLGETCSRNAAQRPVKFDPDVAARELRAMGAKVLWSLSNPDRMRVVSASWREEEGEGEKKKKRKKRPERREQWGVGCDGDEPQLDLDSVSWSGADGDPDEEFD